MLETLHLERIGKLIAQRSYVWQMKFLNANDLSRFASNRSVSFWNNHIDQLWQLGLLRADLIETKLQIAIDGVLKVQETEDGFVYIDTRAISRPAYGWTQATEGLVNLPESMTLWFHPFRYYVLYHLQRVLELNINPMQMLIASRYQGLVDDSIRHFTRLSNSDGFSEVVNKWNNITSLAVVTEPFAFPKMFRTTRFPTTLTFSDLKVEIQQHWEEARQLYQELDPGVLTQLHHEICSHAEMLDSNVKIHNIVRLSKDDELRLKIEDRLGGAIHIRTMAEVIRRGIEATYTIEMLEEDDVRYGPFSKEVKIKQYGGARLFDPGSKGANEYLRKKRLDYSIRLRWYVEGDTEFYALTKAFNIYGIWDVEPRNLGGRFIERKMLAFRDSLKQDMTSNIFSFISLDGDRPDNLRVVRKAAEEGVFLGIFFISKPDFEFANFTHEELVEILWETTPEIHAQPDIKARLLAVVADTTNGKQFLNKAITVSPHFKLNKGEVWGEKLMEYALRHPQREGKERPIIEAFNVSFTASLDRFMDTKDFCKVDPGSGKIIKKDNT